MFISFFSITMRRERNEPKKGKHVELRQCFALQDRMDDVKIFTFLLRYRAYAHAPPLNTFLVLSKRNSRILEPYAPASVSKV